MSPAPRAPAKVLLFGEYTVLLGGEALAVPLRDHGAWWLAPGEPHAAAVPEPLLSDLIAHCAVNPALAEALDLPGLRAAVQAGARLASDVPPGVGLGSSAALVAAVYLRARRSEPADLAQLRETLARMEDLFHGRSSGTDPLVSALDAAVYVGPDGPRLVAEGGPLRFSLVDTGAPRSTAALAATFRARLQDAAYEAVMREAVLPCAARCIACWRAGDAAGLRAALRRLSALQLEHLAFAVPEAARPAWRAGLDRGDRLMKLCGAGGGGRLLCFEAG